MNVGTNLRVAPPALPGASFVASLSPDDPFSSEKGSGVGQFRGRGGGAGIDALLAMVGTALTPIGASGAAALLPASLAPACPASFAAPAGAPPPGLAAAASCAGVVGNCVLSRGGGGIGGFPPFTAGGWFTTSAAEVVEVAAAAGAAGSVGATTALRLVRAAAMEPFLAGAGAGAGASSSSSSLSLSETISPLILASV